MSKKQKKVCAILSYIEHLLARCVAISYFTSLAGIPFGFASSVIGLKICAITAGIKTYESIIKMKGKKHDKVVLLAKTK